jgi:hypothetical protein
VDLSRFVRFLMFQILPFAGTLRKLVTCNEETTVQCGCSCAAVRRFERTAQQRVDSISEHVCELNVSRALCLITETLLMATLLHALAALVLGNFRFASFFERAH